MNVIAHKLSGLRPGALVARAPKARKKVARGKREARSPWIAKLENDRPGGPTENGAAHVCRPSGAGSLFSMGPGAACSLRSPWPLATFFRAFGARAVWDHVAAGPGRIAGPPNRGGRAESRGPSRLFGQRGLSRRKSSWQLPKQADVRVTRSATPLKDRL